MDYKIVKDTDSNALEQKVIALHREGWKLVGRAFVFHYQKSNDTQHVVFCQTMSWDEE